MTNEPCDTNVLWFVCLKSLSVLNSKSYFEIYTLKVNKGYVFRLEWHDHSCGLNFGYLKVTLL